MIIRGTHLRSRSLREWLGGLLLVALVIRALVPLGFMPDIRALGNGDIKIVICTADGAKSVSVDPDGQPRPDKGASSHDFACAFGKPVALAIPSQEMPELNGPAAVSRWATSLSNAHPAVSRSGPPLGSRGPPQLS